MVKCLCIVLCCDDVVCWLGGDEFVVIFGMVVIEDELVIVGVKIIYVCVELYFIEGCEFFVIGSVGIVVFFNYVDDFEGFVCCVDMVMYYVKDIGKNYWVLFFEIMSEGL